MGEVVGQEVTISCSGEEFVNDLAHEYTTSKVTLSVGDIPSIPVTITSFLTPLEYLSLSLRAAQAELLPFPGDSPGISDG